MNAWRRRPEHPAPHVIATASYGLAGNGKKAVDALARLKALVPEITASNVEKTFPYVDNLMKAHI